MGRLGRPDTADHRRRLITRRRRPGRIGRRALEGPALSGIPSYCLHADRVIGRIELAQMKLQSRSSAPMALKPARPGPMKSARLNVTPRSAALRPGAGSRPRVAQVGRDHGLVAEPRMLAEHFRLTMTHHPRMYRVA